MQPTQRDIDLIYKHTHNDYRSMFNNEKSVLALTNKGTSIVAIQDLPEAEFKSRLESARKKEAGYKTTWN